MRRLHGDVVADAVVGVEPEVRRGLEAAAGGGQQALGDVALLRPMLAGLGAIHVDHEFGIVEGLLDAQVGGSGDVLDLVEQLLGEGAIAVQVGADDLDIDGRGKAEVEDLRDHVDGQRVEGHAGKARGRMCAELLHIIVGGVMLFGKRDLNVGVGGADGAELE